MNKPEVRADLNLPDDLVEYSSSNSTISKALRHDKIRDTTDIVAKLIPDINVFIFTG